MDGRWFERNHTYEIVDPQGAKYTVEAPANVSESAIVDFAKKTGDTKRADCRTGHPGPWCDDPISLKMPRNDDIGRVALVAILPPILLLVFGASVYWALAGFRSGVA